MPAECAHVHKPSWLSLMDTPLPSLTAGVLEERNSHVLVLEQRRRGRTATCVPKGSDGRSWEGNGDVILQAGKKCHRNEGWDASKEGVVSRVQCRSLEIAQRAWQCAR